LFYFISSGGNHDERARNLVFGESSYKKINVLGFGIPMFVLVFALGILIYAKRKKVLS